jgi:hypothetical protein
MSIRLVVDMNLSVEWIAEQTSHGFPAVHFQRELAVFRGERRVWIIIAHRQTTEETAIQAYLDSMSRREEELQLADALVLRYDLAVR